MHKCFKSIAVVGTVRNCEKTIISDYNRLKKSLCDFKNISFFIVESDSSDKSVDKLERLKSNDVSFDYISLGFLKTKLPQRTRRIAFCRNKYLEELQNNPKYKEIDYVLVTDFDGTNNMLSREGILSCWEFDKWDVCTANQKGLYFDIWALRHPIWSPNDCWQQFDFLTKELKMNKLDAFRKAIQSRQLHIPESCSPIEVESSFGGLGIYTKKAIEKSQYIGIDNYGNEVCEHVSFHTKIRESGFKVFINPKLINCGSNKEHTKLSSKIIIKHYIKILFPNLTRDLQKYIKRIKVKFGKIVNEN